MKIRFIFSIIAISFSLKAWSYDGQPSSASDMTDRHSYWGAAGAYYFLPLGSLNSQISTYGFSKGFTNATAVGIDHGGEATSDKFKLPFVSYLSFHYLLPQEITSTLNSSDKMKLNGYNFQFDFLAWNYLKSEQFSFTAGLAWAFGRLKVTENSPAGTTTFLDKYFAPQLRTEFNIMLGNHFYMGIRASYRVDVTKTGWTRSGIASAPDLPGTRLSGGMVGAFIGFGK